MSLLRVLYLKAYELVPEVYQQNFHSTKKKDVQTFTDFAREKEVQFNLEEFKSCLPPHIKTYLDKRKADNLAQAAVLADDYSLTHNSTFSKSDTESSGG